MLENSNEIINLFKKEGILLIQKISKSIVFDHFIEIEKQILNQFKDEKIDLNLLVNSEFKIIF